MPQKSQSPSSERVKLFFLSYSNPALKSLNGPARPQWDRKPSDMNWFAPCHFPNACQKLWTELMPSEIQIRLFGCVLNCRTRNTSLWNSTWKIPAALLFLHRGSTKQRHVKQLSSGKIRMLHFIPNKTDIEINTLQEAEIERKTRYEIKSFISHFRNHM